MIDHTLVKIYQCGTTLKNSFKGQLSLRIGWCKKLGENISCLKTLGQKKFRSERIMAIYGPMIYTAPYVIVLMRADTLRGQVGGGWALEIETFLSPVKWHWAIRPVPFWAQRTQNFQGQPPPTCPSKGFTHIKSIKYRAISIRDQ
jgi:hypothetical protein